MTSLRSGENPPPAEGWQPASHMSGTPFGIAALKTRDTQALLESMAYSRETFKRPDPPLTLTQYYVRSEYVACTIGGEVASAAQASAIASLVDTLALGEPRSSSSSLVRDLRKQYQLADGSPVYRKDGFFIIVEPGASDAPELLTIFVIKG